MAMDKVRSDIRLETKNGPFIAMYLHSCKKEIFLDADLVLIKNDKSKYRSICFLRVCNDYCGILSGI